MGTAPVPEEVSTTTAGTMSAQQIEVMARGVYDAFNARDRAAALVSDDCEWLDVVSNNVFRGSAASRSSSSATARSSAPAPATTPVPSPRPLCPRLVSPCGQLVRPALCAGRDRAARPSWR